MLTKEPASHSLREDWLWASWRVSAKRIGERKRPPKTVLSTAGARCVPYTLPPCVLEVTSSISKMRALRLKKVRGCSCGREGWITGELPVSGMEGLGTRHLGLLPAALIAQISLLSLSKNSAQEMEGPVIESIPFCSWEVGAERIEACNRKFFVNL